MQQPNLILQQQKHIRVSPNILDVLFKHKNEIFKKLTDIRGIYSIDHVAINLINPDNELVVFSTTPSVEYNLIINELWKEDKSFSPASFENGALVWWEQGYSKQLFNEIKYYKETMHHFSLGFNLVRKADGFLFTYSFATRDNKRDLRNYYLNLKNELLHLGDYGYKLLRDLYCTYCTNHTPPHINSSQKAAKEKHYLKLLVSNQDRQNA